MLTQNHPKNLIFQIKEIHYMTKKSPVEKMLLQN